MVYQTEIKDVILGMPTKKPIPALEELEFHRQLRTCMEKNFSVHNEFLVNRTNRTAYWTRYIALTGINQSRRFGYIRATNFVYGVVSRFRTHLKPILGLDFERVVILIANYQPNKITHCQVMVVEKTGHDYRVICFDPMIKRYATVNKNCTTMCKYIKVRKPEVSIVYGVQKPYTFTCVRDSLLFAMDFFLGNVSFETFSKEKKYDYKSYLPRAKAKGL